MFRLALILAITGVSRIAAAEGIELPYDAAVSDPSAIVRCGPGQEYYGTSQLRQGERVRVRRHDPDGWFMIDPPADSFSLVRADDIERAGNIGTVRDIEQGQLSVRVGSALDPTADRIFQRRLSPGEQVEILGLVTITRREREIAMYKVRPPRGEYRWIEAASLTALDPHIQELIVRDSSIAPQRPSSSSMPNASPVSTPERQVGPGEVVVPQRQQPLRESGTPQKTPSTAVASTLGRSRAAYDEFVKLTTETSRRDAELAAIQSAYAPQNTRPPAPLPSFARGTNPPADSRAETGNTSGPTTLPSLDVPVPQDTPAGPESNPTPQQPPAQPETKPIEVPVAPPSKGQEPAAASPTFPANDPPASQPEEKPAPAAQTPPIQASPAPSPKAAPQSNPVELAQPRDIPEDATSQSTPAAPPVNTLSPPTPDVSGSVRTAPPRQVRPPGGPALDGAGIVQRSATPGNTPRHVLVAPSGKILAYLHPEKGVSLEPYVGRSMGIIGKRGYRQELQTDLIIVHSLVPVRLVD